MKKGERQEFLCSVIKNKKYSTQEEIVSEMIQMGWEVTQSSVSRDMNELGVVKKHGMYTIPAPMSEMPIPTFSIKESGNSLLVLKTSPGLAPSLALFLDGKAPAEIAGTIAGDDTVFVATNGKVSTKEATKILYNLLNTSI